MNVVEQSFAQNVNKMEVNIKTFYITYGISCNFNPKNLSISGFYIKYSPKVTILQLLFF